KFEVLREKDLQGLKGVAVIPVHVDTLQQKAWLIAGSSNARAHFEMDMYEMDLKTRKCMPIIFRKGSTQLDTTTIEAILVKPYKNGLMVYDEKLPGLFEVIPGKQFADVLIPLKTHTMVGEVEIEEDRFIFLRSYEALPNLSYEMKNGTWTKIPHMLDSFPWQSLVFNENDKTHWISFENELVHYDKDFRRIRAYAWGDENIEMILDMVLDVKGNPWFINDIGRVGRLDVATHVISYLSAADGYQYKDFDWSTPMLKDARGNLYLGTGYTKGSEGLDVVNVNLYTPAHAPSIYLRSLAINQKPYDHSVALNRLTELSLAHDQNSFVLETGIIDHYSTGTGRLRHRLEKNGKAEDWLSGSTYHTIRYDDLAPGLYQLVIQASDAGSNFSTERTITITVNSPFWETWWFRTLVVLTVIFGTYTIIQLRSRSLRERNAELEGRVIVRTKELRHSLEELRATQAQLIQSEKMASLGELTAGIAHEIQNPLNFVNNFSDLNKELFAEMNEEIEKGNLDEVKAIAKDIADNEAKINHHGKRADAIVKGMLQHSRVRDGKKELTDINRLADEYLRLAYHGLRAKDKSFNASIKTDFDESVKSIEIIPQDIGRVVLNLITNAFYAVTEKRKVQFNHQMAGQSVYEPTVWISTTKTSNTLELRVKDNGNGIPKNVIDKIFQPFFTTKPTGQGTGLGLSLSYDIIKAHGGELLVETTEGEGATFIMKLPAT
ncbi:MAG TPA: ATP-binding protein, partial [Chryseolinea sp.]|nr:ATP-binding protein [Chryseolinea sp.]